MLSGYTGSKEAVQTVGNIGRELREIAGSESRAFFWSECDLAGPQDDVCSTHVCSVRKKSSIQSWVTKAAST